VQHYEKDVASKDKAPPEARVAGTRLFSVLGLRYPLVNTHHFNSMVYLLEIVIFQLARSAR